MWGEWRAVSANRPLAPWKGGGDWGDKRMGRPCNLETDRSGTVQSTFRTTDPWSSAIWCQYGIYLAYFGEGQYTKINGGET